MKKKDVFPSDYLKSVDVSGAGETYTVQSVVLEVFKDPKTQEEETKPVVKFKEIKKGLILNVTNWDRIAKLHGDDSDSWVGKPVTLHLESVTAFGKTDDAIRVRI